MNNVHTGRPCRFMRCGGKVIVLFVLVFLASVRGGEAEVTEGIQAVEPGTGVGRLVIFPFKNMTQDRNALDSVVPFIRAALVERGVELVEDQALMKYLIRHRIREEGYLDRETVKELSGALHANTILVGAVISYKESPNPMLGIVVRLIDVEGNIRWAQQMVATGQDFTTVLGLGTIREIDDLVKVIVDRLFATFGNEEEMEARPPSVRVTVLPFRNQTSRRDAGFMASYLLVNELFNKGLFMPIEFGDVWRFMVERRIRLRGELNFAELDELWKELGADMTIIGTVEEYDEGDRESPPKVSISARLVDTRAKRILWSGRVILGGDDELIVFEWGKMRSSEKVAQRVISKLSERIN